MLKQRNSKKQGDVGLGVAIAWFTEGGHTVCIPLTDSQAYDLVVDFQGMLARVQVKTSRAKNQYGRFTVALRTVGGTKSSWGKIKKFDPEAVDFLFVLTDEGVKYLIPVSELEARSNMALGEKHRKYIVGA